MSAAAAASAETAATRRGATFAAMAVRNYRFYFFGQIISVSGTWMQSLAQAWLVLELTHNGTWVGLVTAAQFLPMMLAGPYGGLIADRVDKRTMLLFTQAAAGSLAQKKKVPVSAGTFPTHGPLFVLLLTGTVVIVGALTFFPALSLGPVVEHFLMVSGKLWS